MNIKKIRSKQGWSQSELANKLEISTRQLSRFENGAKVDKRTELAIRYLIKN